MNVELKCVEENKYPCFGTETNKGTGRIFIVEFHGPSSGSVVYDSDGEFETGHYSGDWTNVSTWDKTTKELTLKFTL